MKRKFIPVKFPNKDFQLVVRKNAYFSPSGQLHSQFREIEIHYFTEGKGTYLINNKLYDVAGGSLLIIHRNELHNIVSVGKSYPLKFYSIYFTAKTFDNFKDFKPYLLKNIFRCRPDFVHVLNMKENKAFEIDYLVRSMFGDYEKKEQAWKEALIVQLVRLVILANRAMSQNPAKENKLRKKEDMQKVLDYIEKNILKELFVENIASEVGLSPNYLSFKFKRALGMNLKNYINARKINEAKKILERTPPEKIISIAYSLSFKDLSHFNHTFKKFAGLSPSSYRKLVLNA